MTDMAIVERVIAAGDLEQLTPAERVKYYTALCESLGLNPLTRPFEYMRLQGKLTLYMRRDGTDQLRRNRGVSVTGLSAEVVRDVYTVTAKGHDADGRVDTATGSVYIGNLQGEALANAMMKAETKAKRRLTLSLCGLGFMDETEVETIPAEPAVEPEKPAAPAPAVQNGATISGSREECLAFNNVARTAKTRGWTDDDIRALLKECGDYRKATAALIEAEAVALPAETKEPTVQPEQRRKTDLTTAFWSYAKLKRIDQDEATAFVKARNGDFAAALEDLKKMYP